MDIPARIKKHKERALKALSECHGIVSHACKVVKIDRTTFYNWVNNDLDFKKAVESIQESAIDYVEGKLFERIHGVEVQTGIDDEGNAITYKQPPSDTAIIFYLKTKGKKRGYVERIEKEEVPPAKTVDDLTDAELNELIQRYTRSS